MAPLFTPTADAVFRFILGAVAGAPVVLVVALMLLARSPLATGGYVPVQQPLEFDHRHHVSDEGIDCLYCHDTVTTQASAGFPPTSRCMGCHAQVWNEAEKLRPVRESAFTGQPLVWNKVHRLPDYVFFNHAIHVNKGVGCETCHGRVDQMPSVARVAPLTMGWCLECHRDPAPHLRPLNAITRMGWRLEQGAQPVGETPSVHPQTECTTCHR